MELLVKGGARASVVSDIRTLRTFRIGPAGMKVELHEVWTDPVERLAWVVCNTGTWRLPERLYPWAEQVEDQAAALGFYEPFPCRAAFIEQPDGSVEVEIFPEGYQPSWK